MSSEIAVKDLSLYQYKMDVINTIVSNMFEDGKHYCYYSEMIINILRTNDSVHKENNCGNFYKSCFIEKDNEHINMLKKEFAI